MLRLFDAEYLGSCEGTRFGTPAARGGTFAVGSLLVSSNDSRDGSSLLERSDCNVKGDSRDRVETGGLAVLTERCQHIAHPLSPR